MLALEEDQQGSLGLAGHTVPRGRDRVTAAGTTTQGELRENICWKESSCLGLSVLGCFCKCLRKQMFLANTRISTNRDSLLSLQPHKVVVNIKHMLKPQPASVRVQHMLSINHVVKHQAEGKSIPIPCAGE